ncbi:MAG: TIGR00269 family protein [Desulfurococcaceae archaeon]
MVKCSRCDRSAVYVNKISNIAYCKLHFVEYFEHRVRKTIRKYGMVQPGDHVLVGVSGGKDSMALLHLLLKLRGKIPGLEITAVLVNEGIAGYREKTIPNLVNYAERRAVRYVIASFKDYVGKTLDEIVRDSFERELPYMPCSYCGVFRRYVLNKVAREIGATVIATAHNMDDIIQTYLMNLISNSWDRALSLSPVRSSSEEFIVKRIKPFYEVPEKETTIYALLNNLVQLEFVQCPYVKYNVRFVVRKMLNELEEKYPGSKYGLLRSLLELLKMRGKDKPVTKKYTRCVVCGNPASRAICKACLFKAKLGLLKPGEERALYEAARTNPEVARLLRV